MACKHCGMTLEYIDRIVKARIQRFAPLVDPWQTLDPSARTDVLAFLEKLSRSFPQLQIMVYLGRIRSAFGLSVRECAFWLINRSLPPPSQDPAAQAYAIVLLIDDFQKESALTVGYALEGILSEQDLLRALAAADDSLLSGNYAQATIAVLGALAALLMPQAMIADGNGNPRSGSTPLAITQN
jgi:hypothetical protein